MRPAGRRTLAGVLALLLGSGCAETAQVRSLLTERPDAATRTEVSPPSDPPPPLAVGEPAPAFTLTDLSGQRRDLERYVARGDVVVLEWVDPTSRAWRRQHTRRGDLERAFRRFDPAGVTWLGICSFGAADSAASEDTGAGDDLGRPGPGRPRSGRAPRLEPPGPDVLGPSPPAVLPWSEEQAAARCRAATNELGIMFPVLLDAGGEVARRYGVSRVPHVVVVDREGRIVFSGAPQPVKPPPATPLARALEAVLRGEGPGDTSLPAGSPSPVPTAPAPPLPREDSPDDEVEEHHAGEEEPTDDDDEYDIEESYLDEEDE